jgi:ABC-2 type transport system permease protein
VIRRIAAIAKKELVQLRRDRLTMSMMVGIPIMQLLLFGYAINTDVRDIRTLVVDHDRTPGSRDLVRQLEATSFYRVVGAADSYEDVARALRSGEARVALVIEKGYGAHLASGKPARAQLVVDGSDPQIVANASQSAASLVAVQSTQLVVSRLRAAGGQPPASVSLEPVTWYNPELRTAVFVVPGLVGVILTMTMVMLTAMAIARERERGTLELIIVSPVQKIELMTGKILPYVAIGYVQMTIILWLGSWLFGVPIIGSLALLYGIAFFFIAANLALGLFFSTLAKTQQQAMQMSFFFLLPNLLLSGFMFPWEAMPRPAQWLSQGLPLTHFLVIVRGVVLKGSQLADLVPHLLAMAAILVVLVGLASTRFQKQLA